MHGMGIQVLARGELVDRRPCQELAVVLFVDHADAPFLQEWLDENADGRWGTFESFVMDDVAFPATQWARIERGRWGTWCLPARTRARLPVAPLPDHTQALVAAFSRLAQHRGVLFSCTYGKSRSALAAAAYRAWLEGNRFLPADAPRERNPWWAHLLEEAIRQEQPRSSLGY